MTFSAQETVKIRKKSTGKDGIFATSEINDSNTSEIISLGFASKSIAVQASGDLTYDIEHSLDGVNFETDAGNQNKSAPLIVPVITTQNHPITSIRITQRVGTTAGKVVIAAT